METWSLDSLLVSFISDHRWKWIYNLPRLQQTKSTHQNQRVYCFTRRGGFICWFERYSFRVLLRHYKHLLLASSLVPVGEFYKEARLIKKNYSKLRQIVDTNCDRYYRKLRQKCKLITTLRIATVIPSYDDRTGFCIRLSLTSRCK